MNINQIADMFFEGNKRLGKQLRQEQEDEQTRSKRKDLADFLGCDSFMDQELYSSKQIEMKWYKEFQHDYQDEPLAF